jgi:hypothetical protein
MRNLFYSMYWKDQLQLQPGDAEKVYNITHHLQVHKTQETKNIYCFNLIKCQYKRFAGLGFY